MRRLLFCVILVVVILPGFKSFVRQSGLYHSVRHTTYLYGIADSLQILDDYNREYLLRMRDGRKEGLTPMAIEFRRVQELKADVIKAEREKLKTATLEVAEESVEVVMGIMAESGSAGIKTLKGWVSGLGLSRGLLTAIDASGKQISVESLQDVPVYIKYNSTAGGDAYMKSYDGGGVGVTFQPKLKTDSSDEFRQYGDLVLTLFR